MGPRVETASRAYDHLHAPTALGPRPPSALHPPPSVCSREQGDAAACEAQVAAERFLLVMKPFADGAAPQLAELRRAAGEMAGAQVRSDPVRELARGGCPGAEGGGPGARTYTFFRLAVSHILRPVPFRLAVMCACVRCCCRFCCRC